MSESQNIEWKRDMAGRIPEMGLWIRQRSGRRRSVVEVPVLRRVSSARFPWP